MKRLVLALLCVFPLAARAADISHAQAPLATEDMVIVTHDGKPHLFHVEMAVTGDQQEIGLMWRTSLAADRGMLFQWTTPQVSSIWMKNTLIPLDIISMAADGTVTDVSENAVPQSLAIINSSGAVSATVELQGGIAEALDIRVGDKVQQRIFNGAK